AASLRLAAADGPTEVVHGPGVLRRNANEDLAVRVGGKSNLLELLGVVRGLEEKRAWGRLALAGAIEVTGELAEEEHGLLALLDVLCWRCLAGKKRQARGPEGLIRRRTGSREVRRLLGLARDVRAEHRALVRLERADALGPRRRLGEELLALVGEQDVR